MIEDKVLELVLAVKALKKELDENGPYSICLSNKQNMGWGEVLYIDSVLERVDNAVKAVEDFYKV